MNGSADDGRPAPLWNALALLEETVDRADGVLVCLDFDGTLSPIVDDPDDAAIRPGCRRALLELRDRPGVELAVVSGRRLTDVRERVDVAGVHYAGNHGLEWWRDGEPVGHPEAEAARADVASACDALAERLADVDGVRVEGKGLTATVHHRRADEAGAVAARTAATEVAADAGLECSAGKQIFELRPDVEWDKGDVVQSIAAHVNCGLTVMVGDDVTDEAVFRVLTYDGVGIKVGDGEETAAGYRLPDPEGVQAFLEWLAGRTASDGDGTETGRSVTDTGRSGADADPVPDGTEPADASAGESAARPRDAGG